VCDYLVNIRFEASDTPKRRKKDSGLTMMKATIDVHKIVWEQRERVDICIVLLGSTIQHVECAS
jgi:hypothetical protein